MCVVIPEIAAVATLHHTMGIFYKPDDGWAADFIPFFHDGVFHLFYLKDYRDKERCGEGTPWFHISTRDFVEFTDHGEALPRGTVHDQDLYVFTGSVYAHGGRFHIFYTGHNPHFRAAGRPEQAVMHAVSDDLIHWEKNPANPILFADAERFEVHDWRDPFVFWNEERQEHWMLLAARARSGPQNRRGITALCTSKDLNTWTIVEPFWTPGLYFTHECPDLFRMGDAWYSVYSTFSERMLTHYRTAPSLAGPWTAPTDDSFDGRAFYAAKTASDERRRYVFGWVPSRTGESDAGAWNWGGNLVVHEVVQQSNGALSVRVPSSVLQHFSRACTLSPQPRIGAWTHDENGFTASAPDSFAWLHGGELPTNACLIEATLVIAEGTRSAGLVFRSDDALDRGYLLRLEPGRARMAFERFPRPGDEPPLIERPADLACGRTVQLRILIEGSVLVAYLDDVLALSTRIYDHAAGGFGAFVAEGAAQFTSLSLRVAE
jgi:beta-fructofuranosidase